MSGYPRSVSNYQYQSSAVRENKLHLVYHKCNSNNSKYDITCLCGDIFFSFIFVIPFVAMIIYAIVIASEHKAIKKSMKKQKNHQNFAALISLGLTIGWYITILDIIAVFCPNPTEIIHIIYYSEENPENEKLNKLLCRSLMVELAICCLGEIWIWIATFRQWKNRKYNNSETVAEARDCCISRWFFCVDTKWEDDKFWWFLLLLFIPPIWCLSSHFGFVIIAWSSFVRHSKSLTLFYIFAITVMFLVMRQSYTLIVNILYSLKKGVEKAATPVSTDVSDSPSPSGDTPEHSEPLVPQPRENSTTPDSSSSTLSAPCTNKDEKQEKDGILVWVIQLVRVVGVLLVGFFIYLILGLWFLPVTETVEEVPVYLYDFLELIIIVLAILMSYHLISLRDNHENGENGGYRPIPQL